MATFGNLEKDIFQIKLKKRDIYFPDRLLNQCCTISNDNTVVVDIKKYRQLYMDSLFPDNVSLESICHEYLEGMQWVLTYYVSGVSTWDWQFPYHYAPFAYHISRHISTFEFKKYPRTNPTTPYQQLLSVLPPKSASLIPTPLSSLLTDEDSPLLKWCPKTFEIDLSGKRQEWEGISLICPMDMDVMRQEYFRRINLVNPKVLKRNKLGKSFVYYYTPSISFNFCSYYGDIPECRVKVNLIKI
jgi:5'-3' exoribonuclease 1